MARFINLNNDVSLEVYDGLDVKPEVPTNLPSETGTPLQRGLPYVPVSTALRKPSIKPSSVCLNCKVLEQRMNELEECSHSESVSDEEESGVLKALQAKVAVHDRLLR